VPFQGALITLYHSNGQRPDHCYEDKGLSRRSTLITIEKFLGEYKSNSVHILNTYIEIYT